MKRRLNLLLAAAVVAAAGLIPSASRAQRGASHANDERVEQLLQQMTLEEKAGQLEQETGKLQTGPNGNNLDGQEGRIVSGATGTVLNTLDIERMNALQTLAVQKTRLHIPLIFAYDVIHGFRTEFPVPLALSATWDTALIEQTARVAATEAARNGIRWVFSPMVDISRDARWGRIVESAGEDPYLGSAIAQAYVRGYQGKGLSDPSSVAACVKHFAAYGAVIAGREYNAVDMSDLTLQQVYLPPYRAAVQAGAATVMTSFNTLNGVPASASFFLLRQTLRDRWGFTGIVVTDWGALPQLQAHGVALTEEDAARKGMLAGVDVDMVGKVYPQHLPTLVRAGKVPQALVDDAVRRVLRLKFELGMFDRPYTDASKANQPPSAESRLLAQKAAEESIVLLKNDLAERGSALLPMQPGRRIALIGSLADSSADMLGSWVAQGKAEDVQTLRTALEQRAKAAGGSVTYAQGTDITSASDAGFAAALAAASHADVIVMALGEAGLTMSGEMGSRTRLDLPGNQEQLLEAVVATGRPVVLVLFNGHPLALPWAAEHVNAIVEAWFPGIAAGPALANILFGDVNPSGHLTVTVPRSVGQEPLFYNQLNTGRPAKPYATKVVPQNEKGGMSRYIDELNDPLFPFGYGGSYTTFTVGTPKVSRSSLTVVEASHLQAAPIVVSVELSNTGTRAGDDVVQLYLRRTGTSIAEPLRELRGFRRVSLTPGETLHLEFRLAVDDLAVMHADGTATVEPMHVDLYAGDSSLATAHAVMDITP